MPNTERTSSELTEFEVRWNPRSFWWNVLLLFVLFLVYTATAVLASGSYRLLGVAGAILFGVMVPYAGVAGAKQLRRRPVAVVLNEFGVTFDRHDPVAWETIREVHLGRAKPHLLFILHPLYYVAFLPKQAADPHSLTPRKRMTNRIYGTTLVLTTNPFIPSGEDILSAVERLSDVPVSRWSFRQ
jgi:hypothetical protein